MSEFTPYGYNAGLKVLKEGCQFISFPGGCYRRKLFDEGIVDTEVEGSALRRHGDVNSPRILPPLELDRLHCPNLIVSTRNIDFHDSIKVRRQSCFLRLGR